MDAGNLLAIHRSLTLRIHYVAIFPKVVLFGNNSECYCAFNPRISTDHWASRA